MTLQGPVMALSHDTTGRGAASRDGGRVVRGQQGTEHSTPHTGRSERLLNELHPPHKSHFNNSLPLSMPVPSPAQFTAPQGREPSLARSQGPHSGALSADSHLLLLQQHLLLWLGFPIQGQGLLSPLLPKLHASRDLPSSSRKEASVFFPAMDIWPPPWSLSTLRALQTIS